MMKEVLEGIEEILLAIEDRIVCANCLGTGTVESPYGDLFYLVCSCKEGINEDPGSDENR